MKRKHEILIHIIFWFFYIFFPFLPLLFSEGEITEIVYVYSYCNTVLNIISFYICYFATKPDIFKRERAVRNSIIFIAFNLLFTAFRVYSTLFVYYLSGVLPDEYTITFGAVIYEFLNTLGFTFGPITIKFSVDWFREHRQKTELLTQNQASELALLRSQINPHFLFNTLNNIYALVYKKSDEAPEAVMKLSGIMRYMLDDSTGDKVELKKEIEYLNNYIELQKLRIADKEFVEFVINGEPENKYITPMIFIPFIENAFKHCDKSHEPPGIIIQIDILENKILLYSKNYYTNEEPQSKDLTGGIGLANVRRRLELLYPNRHKLAINSAENTFVVELELNEL